jgi:hypothetical protein
VRVGKAISTTLTLASVVPQGGILSPIIFTIYTTDNKSKNPAEIKTRLEEDAQNVLSYMHGMD